MESSSLLLPSYTQIAHDSAMTTDVIAAVLEHPLVVYVVWILPIAKALLLAAVIIPLIFNKFGQRFLLGYYGLILLIIGLMQNMSFTVDYGFTWLIGNTLVQFAVVGFCLADVLKNKTFISKQNFIKRRLWIVAPMIFAFLMPYSVNSANIVYPSFTLSVLFNESGVTYCMITPVIIGVLLLYSKGVHKPTLSVISYVGFIFGLLNMMTWFAIRTENWWMGVLHLPLVILSIYGLLVAHNEKSLA
ncbi:hypothetical protein [Desulfitobacterium sp.]|uniref:hypothetical protein n=1 Tax=Desulfitobacterium sp. TaxID=49981 RepID=UPI002CFFB5D7|nr:hypothetical protein [Desulfitobacterium sp.]HVJ50660.1 hypothetical protein [Desulfitobacterium sp.]